MAANETAQERTEQATPRRRDKAFREGQIARSQELSTAAILIAGAGAMVSWGGNALAEGAVGFMRTASTWMAGAPLTEPTTTALLRDVGRQTLAAFGPFALSVFGLTLAVNIVQARGVLSWHPITPKWSHVSPLSGLKRAFSMQAVFNLVKAVAKLAFLSVVTLLAIRGSWVDVLALSRNTVLDIAVVLEQSGAKMALAIGLAFLIVAGADYAFQVFQHAKKLRMSKQEVLQEHKETEGDPLIKGRIRAIALALSRKRMMQDVETADVVVTNPTRLAVALKYDPEVAAAPIVVAMGARKLAARIREVAAAAGVPIVENKPLAQALTATASVGAPIPPALYVAVAEVIAFVYRRKGTPAHMLTAGGGMSQ